MFVKSDKEDKVCKLLKPLYGLKQSGREWYKKLDSFITENGGKRTPADPCVYVFSEAYKRVILVIYVDDLILASKDIEMFKNVKAKLKKLFKMTDLGRISNILGMKVQREDETGKIRLSQQKYVNELLERFSMRNSKEVSTPIESNLKISKDMCPQTEDERHEMIKRL